MALLKLSRLYLIILIGSLFYLSGCIIIDINNDQDISNNDYSAEESFSYDITVDLHTWLRLTTINGDVKIEGHSGTDAVHIYGTRRVESESARDAEQHLEMLQVEVLDLSDKIVVRTEQPEDAQGRNYIVAYTVLLPDDFDVFVDHVNGNIVVSDITGDATVNHVNGNVTMYGMSGDLIVDLINGNIDGDAVLRFDGSIDLTTTNGNIDLEIPTASSAELSVEVVLGSFETSNLLILDLVQDNRSLEGTLGDGNGQILLRTVNGNIRISGVG